MKIAKIIFSALLLFTFLLDANTYAQDEAVPFYSTGQIGAFSINGAGFAFSSNVSIAVTALGFGGSDLINYPYQVSIYDAGGDQLATAEVTSESSFYNETYYQSISPISLAAGNTYYIGATELVSGGNNGFSNGGSTSYVGEAVLTYAGGVFSPNPDISYLGAVDDFISGIPQIEQSQSIFLIDDNFQFTVVPEPPILCLSAIGLLVIACCRRRSRSLSSKVI